MKRYSFAVAGMAALLLTGCSDAESSAALDQAEAEQEEALMEESGQKADATGEEAETDKAEPVVQDEKAVQEGPYGRISLTLLEGWDYELCAVGDDRLLSADYGIQFYPEGMSEGYIEVGYHTNFGVCGTGLSEETITVAGEPARAGYYDGSEVWSYLAFEGKDESIVAMNSGAENWWKQHGDEAMKILDTLSYEPDQQSGAIGVYEGNSEIPAIALSVCAEDISPKKCTLRFTQYDGEAITELSFGQEMRIEKKTDEGFQEADIVVEGDYGFKAIAYRIKPEDVTEYAYDWEWLYGELEPGEYRIAVPVNNLRAAGDYDSYTLYAHFILR